MVSCELHELCEVILNIPPAPSAPPTDVTVTTVTSTELLVDWQPPSPIDQNGVILYYDVLYTPLTTFSGLIASASVRAYNLTVLLTGLEEAIGYNVSVRAVTAVGPGPYSQPQPNSTLIDGACIAVHATATWLAMGTSSVVSTQSYSNEGLVYHAHTISYLSTCLHSRVFCCSNVCFSLQFPGVPR